MNLTIKTKLLPTLEQGESLLRTIRAFNRACNYISGIAWTDQRFGKVHLQHRTYREVRDQFGLSAQMAVRAIGKVSESYKAEKKKQHQFKELSAIVYDQRILSFKALDRVSILTLDGRILLPMICGTYAQLHRQMVRGQADLLFKCGKFFLCICVEVPDGTPIDPKGTLGIDLGLSNIATTSDGQFFSGKAVNRVRVRANRLRKNLQHCGSRSAKRHLQKASGRERRFKRNENHRISKSIVRTAKDTGRAIALENLKGFQPTVRKADRERFGKWAFSELRQFISYKAKLAGIPVIAVDPRNTSRQCSACGHTEKANRRSQSEFRCVHCGLTLHADLNAAINIAARAPVNVPIVAPIQHPDLRELQARPLQGMGG